ncbi:type II toxin-antitoxin system HicB family antitoxin [Caulobacter sp. S45]|uniref:type II toxin-antitoxin system HicB family antitoxin n=1 Tax=Caulobacter sp. S45 TaxID=1641861 RepID=UPI00131D88BB|nr:type II toxin-antitoxin system HicB family antitoxin [Caulobacter sp. S45]
MPIWAFPAVFQEEEAGDWVVTFPDIPEVVTGADSLEAARLEAADALEEAILAYMADGRAVPSPRAAGEGEELVTLAPGTASRVTFTVTT